MMSVTFESRQGKALPAWGTSLSVERLSWRAVGGPWAARIRATGGSGPSGDLVRLWKLADLLGARVLVNDESGPAWWGYARGVEIHDGARVVRVSLEGMANRVAVGYREYSPLEEGGLRRCTAFFENAESMATYGVKERIFEMGQASPAQAEACARTWLARVANPQMTIRIDTVAQGGAGDKPGQPYAVIEAMGWWETLDWKFYGEPRGLEGNNNPGKSQRLGEQAGNQGLAQSFVISGSEGWRLNEIWLRLGRFSAADGLSLLLRSDSSNNPGATLASMTRTAAETPEEMGWARFWLPAPATLNPGTRYWFSLARSGGVDAAAYWNVSVSELPDYAGGEVRLWNGGSWAARAPAGDAVFLLVGVEETTTQLARMLAGGPGQFLAETRMLASSGVNARLFRDGTSARGRQEVEALLRVGDSAGRRLLANVDAARIAHVQRQPEEPGSAAITTGAAGELRTQGGLALGASANPAGSWVGLGAVATAGVLLGRKGSVFVEACAWEDKRGVYITEV